ncbi:MAG: ATP-dependent protease subunit HslV [Thermoanaerobaculales bacterium]|nr:ATP-dependent protease subunit HslV [Thermoanaerobaculales bacterium]
MEQWHHTTVLAVRRDNKVAIGSDGQVTLGNTVMKHTAAKVRRLGGGRIIAGFAGSVADALALFTRFEAKLEAYGHNLERSAVELAREWRTDRALRHLEAMLITADATTTLLVSGTGEVLSPDDDVVGVGSGGSYALAAARALIAHTELGAREVVEESLKIAGSIDIYTNQHISIEELSP